MYTDFFDLFGLRFRRYAQILDLFGLGWRIHLTRMKSW